MLDHGKLIRTLAEADIITVPSIFKGFGLTALEAMAVKRPVVASTAGGLPEVLGSDAGILVTPGDPVALSDALEKLIVDPDLRAQLGKAGRQRVEEKFELSRIATQLSEVYSDMVVASAPKRD